MSRKRPLSPKESGEVGETYEDLLARHPDPTSTPMQLLHTIQSLSNELTPISILQTERYMVPALSPIAEPIWDWSTYLGLICNSLVR